MSTFGKLAAPRCCVCCCCSSRINSATPWRPAAICYMIKGSESAPPIARFRHSRQPSLTTPANPNNSGKPQQLQQPPTTPSPALPAVKLLIPSTALPAVKLALPSTALPAVRPCVGNWSLTPPSLLTMHPWAPRCTGTHSNNSLNVPLDPSLSLPSRLPLLPTYNGMSPRSRVIFLTLRGIEISEITHELTGRRSLPSVLIEFNQEDRDLAFPH